MTTKIKIYDLINNLSFRSFTLFRLGSVDKVDLILFLLDRSETRSQLFRLDSYSFAEGKIFAQKFASPADVLGMPLYVVKIYKVEDFLLHFVS